MKYYRETVERGTPDFRFSHYTFKESSKIYSFVGLHWHSEIEMLYVKNGAISVTVEERKYILNRGDIIFIEPERVHTVSPFLLPLEYDAAVFSASALSLNSEHFFGKDIIMPIINGNFEFSGIIDSSFKDYDKLKSHVETLLNKESSKTAVFASLVGIISLIYDDEYIKKSSRQISKYSSDIKKCLMFIDENYNRKIKLSELSGLIHVSENYFCGYFKKYTGITPFEQINETRVKKAAAFLSDWDLTVSEIAVKCGFENLSYFTRKFKSIIGCTPIEYRKAKKQSALY